MLGIFYCLCTAGYCIAWTACFDFQSALNTCLYLYDSNPFIGVETCSSLFLMSNPWIICLNRQSQISANQVQFHTMLHMCSSRNMGKLYIESIGKVRMVTDRIVKWIRLLDTYSREENKTPLGGFQSFV